MSPLPFTPKTLFLLAAALAMAAPPGSDGLDAVKAETNLDKRAELALNYANEALDKARTLYKDAHYDESRAAVIEVQASVEVCHEALKATGKDPRKNSKEFKRIEQRIQALIRRLRGLSQDVSVQDRPVIRKVQSRLEDINDEIVSGIFKKAK